MCPASVKQLVLLESSMKFPVWCVCVHGHVQSGLTLSDPVDCSPPGSSVHGSLQARVLERVAISSSRIYTYQFSLVQFSHSVVSDSL